MCRPAPDGWDPWWHLGFPGACPFPPSSRPRGPLQDRLGLVSRDNLSAERRVRSSPVDDIPVVLAPVTSKAADGAVKREGGGSAIPALGRPRAVLASFRMQVRERRLSQSTNVVDLSPMDGSLDGGEKREIRAPLDSPIGTAARRLHASMAAAGQAKSSTAQQSSSLLDFFAATGWGRHP